MPQLVVYPYLDGMVDRFIAAGESFTSIRGGSGTGANDTNVSMVLNSYAHSSTSSMYIALGRCILVFDTSSLPDGAVISSATLDLDVTYHNRNTNFDLDKICLVSSNPASTSSLVAADYSTLGEISYANDIPVNTISLTTWPDDILFTLNASGLAAISTTGHTKFGLRLLFDKDNTPPTWGAGIAIDIEMATNEDADINLRPKLTVTYTSDTTLLVSDATNSLTTDAINLSTDGTVGTNDATSSLTTDSVALTQLHNIEVQDALLSLATDSILLSQLHLLSAQEALLGLTTDSIIVKLSSEFINNAKRASLSVSYQVLTPTVGGANILAKKALIQMSEGDRISLLAKVASLSLSGQTQMIDEFIADAKRATLSMSGLRGTLGNFQATWKGSSSLSISGWSNTSGAFSYSAKRSALTIGELLYAFNCSVMNLDTSAVTEYVGHNFNSLAVFDSMLLASSYDGLYLLGDGYDTDNGASIQSNIKTLRDDFGSSSIKNVSDCYVGFKGGNLTVQASYDGVSGNRQGVGMANKFSNKKANLSKGESGRYFELKLSNVNGSDFDIDTIELNVHPKKRKV